MKTNNTVKGVGVNKLGDAAPFELKGILSNLDSWLKGKDNAEPFHAALTAAGSVPLYVGRVSFEDPVLTDAGSTESTYGSISTQVSDMLLKAYDNGMNLIICPTTGGDGRSTVFAAVAVPTSQVEGVIVLLGDTFSPRPSVKVFAVIAYCVTVQSGMLSVDYVSMKQGSVSIDLTNFDIFVSPLAVPVGSIQLP